MLRKFPQWQENGKELVASKLMEIASVGNSILLHSGLNPGLTFLVANTIFLLSEDEIT